MALDKLTQITSSGINSATSYDGITADVATFDSVSVLGIATAVTVQVGSATTIHTTGIDLGSGNITSHNINSTGIITATGLDINGNVTGSTASFTGSVGIGTDNPGQELEIFSNAFAALRVKSLRTGLTDQIGGIGFSTTSDQVATINALVDGTVLLKNTTNDTERLRITSDGALGLGGSNYGTAGQVIKSNGTDAAPTWQNLHQFMFFGEQDTEQTIVSATYTRLVNLGTNDFSIGDSSIASFDESIGRVTIGADGAGYYYFQMSAGIDDIQSGDYVQVVIGKNGTASGDGSAIGTRISTYGRDWNGTVANQVAQTATSCIALLAANDYVQFYVYHQEGTDEPTEPNRCSVMGYKL